MNLPKWTVILRTQGKNNSLELKNALYSLVAQEYKNLVVILTIHTNNETRIKETKDFSKNFKNLLKIKVIEIRKNLGKRAHPLNIALKNLDPDTKYLSFLDHDDIYYPWMGSSLINKMKESNKTFSMGRSVNVIQELTRDKYNNKYLYTKNKSLREKRAFSKIGLLVDNYIPFNSFIIDTSLLKNLFFDETLVFLEDWDFLKKLCLKKNFSVTQIDIPVSEYRRRNDYTDTFNKENVKKWKNARALTDKNLQNKKITIDIDDVIQLRKYYFAKFNSLSAEIAKLYSNPALKLWFRLRGIPLLRNTIGRFIRRLKIILNK